MGFTSTRSGTDDPDPVLNQIWCFVWTVYTLTVVVSSPGGSHIDMVYVYVPDFWGAFSQNLV